ncbi:MAG: RagB/SusD family nutrient uptake outer membrane protein [Bacteroidetes bacterium]|nr:RagB/SusD family nutrient uptake outer membrane protein [Bacteroidota bacterium]
MKKYFLLIIVAILFMSCTKSFLETKPEDTLSPDSYFGTKTEIQTGITACYKKLQSIYNQGDMPLVIELMSDDGKDFNWSSPFHIFTKTNSNSQDGIWTNNYKMIVDCNNMLSIIDKYAPTHLTEATDLNAFRGEARFLRALAYFNLVRIYGPVPKVTEPLSDPTKAFGVGRASLDTIYQKVIIPDLVFASTNCYNKGDNALKGQEARATKGAALTILGKVYLTLNDANNAAATLKKLIVDKAAGTNYSLMPSYSAIFQPANKLTNTESIFEVNFNVAAGQASTWFKWMGVDIGKNLLANSSNQMLVEHNLMRDFTTNKDLTRYAASVDSGNCSPAVPPIQAWAKKLCPPAAQIKNYANTGTDYNYIVTRYADALLMYAEALMTLNQKDAAIVYFNQVRTRAGMPAITAAQLNIDMMLHERRMELAFEGHRYFDLVRTGKAIDIITKDLMTKVDYDDKIYINAPIPAYQLFLPIPVSQIQIDPTLPQNSGY